MFYLSVILAYLEKIITSQGKFYFFFFKHLTSENRSDIIIKLNKAMRC